MKNRSRWIRRLTAVVVVALAIWGLYTGFYMGRLSSMWREGKRLYEAGNYVSAARAFREYSSLIPEEAEGHYWLGNALGFSKRLDEAIPELRRAAELDPRNANYQIALGNALQSLNRDVEAEQAFRRALALGANDADLHVSLGIALYRQMRQEEALREWRQAIQIDPGNLRAQKALRRVRGQMDKRP